MREPTIARNYAEALAELAQRAGDLDGWGAMIDEVTAAVQGDVRLQRFLESPRVSAEEKNEIIARAFADRLPRLFVRFLTAVVSHRRQHLIPEIAEQYHVIVDERQRRVHAEVTVAREPDDELREATARELSRVLGKQVIPHFHVRPEILGGTIVRVGDTVMDGSVRRRLSSLRARMLGVAR
ncbi:MAG TPA: F0F1 ATP synthase subunit delta [Gemmatimonadaceae bacterium]|nr:F0F1 ATP synthase subunit delta [Gemmatimonadaceae bacterium]